MRFLLIAAVLMFTTHTNADDSYNTALDEQNVYTDKLFDHAELLIKCLEHNNPAHYDCLDAKLLEFSDPGLFRFKKSDRVIGSRKMISNVLELKIRVLHLERAAIRLGLI